METIQITPDLRLSVEPDYDYRIEAEERGMSDADVADEQYLIETEGVWGVVLQRREVYENKNGRTLTVWEDVDAVWGCFLTDDYTAQVVAADNFLDYPQN